MENNNPLLEDLLKVIGKKNYKGLLVSFLKDGKVMWNGKQFDSLDKLDEYLDASVNNSIERSLRRSV